MPHVSDFQREVITLFKTENPTWGLMKCRQILPNFFGAISKRQMDRVNLRIKDGGAQASKQRKKGSGTVRRVSNSPVRQAVITLAVSPQDKSRRHSSQRQIATALNISKGTVHNILKKSNLKCYKRIQCHKLTPAHRLGRTNKAEALAIRFIDSYRNIWFSDEAHFSLSPPINRQNERIYREVRLKTDIPQEDLLVQCDKQQPSLMCYGSVSYHGKTELRFIEGFAPGQDDIPRYKRKKKTVNQHIYRDEMCPAMFTDIEAIMNGQAWTWQQDGAKAHTANDTVAWLQTNRTDFIQPQQWPAKSPDLNVLDYCVWGLLLAELQSKRSNINSLNELKECLCEAWNSIPMDIICRAVEGWIPRLRKCVEANGGHFEYF